MRSSRYAPQSQPRSQGLFPGLGAPKPGKRPWKKTLGTLYPVAYTSCMGVSRRELNPVSAATRRFSTPPWIGCLSITGISTALNFLVPIYTAGWGVVSFAAVFRKSRNAPPIFFKEAFSDILKNGCGADYTGPRNDNTKSALKHS